MEIDKIALGNRIKSIRLEKSMNLKEFGYYIDNTSDSIVSRWEKGKSVPNAKRLKLIANAGGITVNELIFGSFKTFCFKLFDDFVDGIEQNNVVFNEKFTKEQFFEEMYTRVISHGYGYEDVDDIKYIFNVYLDGVNGIAIGKNPIEIIEFVEKKLALLRSEVKNIFTYPVIKNEDSPGVISLEERDGVNYELYADMDEILKNATKDITSLKNRPDL